MGARKNAPASEPCADLSHVERRSAPAVGGRAGAPRAARARALRSARPGARAARTASGAHARQNNEEHTMVVVVVVMRATRLWIRPRSTSFGLRTFFSFSDAPPYFALPWKTFAKLDLWLIFGSDFSQTKLRLGGTSESFAPAKEKGAERKRDTKGTERARKKGRERKGRERKEKGPKGRGGCVYSLPAS